MATDSIADLVINLRAETASFAKDVAKAGTSLTKLAEVGVAAAAGLAAGLAYMVEGAISTADHMNKLAQSTGVSAEKLSALGYAAKLADVDTEELAKGLFKLSKNMDAASQSADSNVFSRMGIAVKDATGKLRDVDAVLSEIAERFSKMPDGAQKTALSMELFGKSGAKLIPFLNQGREGLAAMKAEADRLGVTIGGKTTQAAEDFNDNITRLNAAMDGTVLQLTAGMLPALKDITDAMVGANSKTSGFQATGKLLGDGFRWIAGAINSANLALGLFVLNYEKLASEKTPFEKLTGIKSPLSPSNRRTEEEIDNQKNELYKQYGEIAAGLRGDLNIPKLDIKKPGNDTFTDLTAALKTVGQIASEDTKALQAMLDKAALAAAGSIEKINMEADIAVRKNKELFTLTEDQRKKLIDVEHKTAAEISAIDADLAKERKMHGVQLAEDLINIEKHRVEAIAIEEQKLRDEIGKTIEALQKEGKIAATQLMDISKLQTIARPNLNRSNPFQLELDKLNDKNAASRISAADQVFQQTRSSAEQYAQQLARLQILLKNGDISQQTFNRAVVQARAAFTPLGQIATQVGESFGTFFQGVIAGTQTLAGAFKSMAQSIVAAIAQVIAKMIALWAIQKLLGFFLPSANAGGSRLDMGGSLGPVIPNITTGVALPPRATGGSVLAGHAYMVGERGPEPFIPSTNGMILSNGSLRGGDTFNIDARGSAPGAAQEWIRAMKENNKLLKQQILGAVRDRALRT